MATLPPDANPVNPFTDLAHPPPVNSVIDAPPPPVGHRNPINSVIYPPSPSADPDDDTLKRLKKCKANDVAVKKYRAKRKKLVKDLENIGDPELVAKASNVKEEKKYFFESVALKKRVTLTLQKTVDLQ